MTSVVVAASSEMAADAGIEVARRGGNAVDVAIASALASLTTETAVASLGGGGFVTVGTPEGEILTVDGYVEMPGRGLPDSRLGEGGREVSMTYGGGVSTIIGPGSVAIPGTLAALDRTWSDHGSLPWDEIVAPSHRLAEEGFPLTPAARQYLLSSHEVIFGWHPETRRALHRDDGSLLEAGERVHVPGLPESLEAIAVGGARVFYEGDLARRIADHIQDLGGMMTREDLESYRPRVRPALVTDLDGWKVFTNPPPAIGGAVLTAMLLLMDGHPRGVSGPGQRSEPGEEVEWSPVDLERLIRVQEAVLGFRADELDGSTDMMRDVSRLLEQPTLAGLRSVVESGSTIHVSAVDSEGRACSISASTGYGSGVMAPGTGIFLNNCLGETELCPRGLASWPVGTRLPSNMAPTIARRSDGSVLAVGSPGAGRITTALQQVLLSFIRLEMGLEEAIAHPRLHVELERGATRVAHEPGLDLEGLTGEKTSREGRPFEEISMFFGGVAAALWRPGEGFEVAADPRRAGGVGVFEATGATGERQRS